MDKFFYQCKNHITKLVPNKNKELITCYLNFVSLGFKVINNDNLKSEIKLKKFDLLYRQIFKNCSLKGNVIYKLQKYFIAENISLSLLSDIIKALKELSLKEQYQTWNKFIYCSQLFLSPIVRMIMVLNNLNASVYMPFMSVMMSWLMLETGEYKKIEEFQNYSKLKYHLFYTDKIRGFLKEGKVSLQVVSNKVFRYKLCYLVSMLDVILEKFFKREKLKLSIVDLNKILFYSTLKWLFTRVKTLKIEGA